MRMGKCGYKNADEKKKNADNKKVRRKKKTRNADKTNKQLRKETFLSSSCHMVGPFTYIQNVMPIVDTAVILYSVISFINVTEIRMLRSSSLNTRILGALLL